MSQEQLLKRIEASLNATKDKVDDLERRIVLARAGLTPDGREKAFLPDGGFDMHELHGFDLDFDLCFQFQLPKYVAALAVEKEQAAKAINHLQKGNTGKDIKSLIRHNRKLQRQLERAEEEEKGRREKFFRRLRHLDANQKRLGKLVDSCPTEESWGHRKLSSSINSVMSTFSHLHEDAQKSAKALFESFMVADQDEVILSDFRLDSLDSCRACAIEMLLKLFDSPDYGYHKWWFTSIDLDELFICVKINETAAKQHAHKSRFRFPLDNNALDGLDISLIYERSASWIPKWIIELFRFDSDPKTGQPIYDVPASVMYDPRIPDDWFLHHECEHPNADGSRTKSIVTKIDSMRLMYDQITDKIDIESMKSNFVLKDWFPLHTAGIIHASEGDLPAWGNLWNPYLTFPIGEIRKYFGEMVALHFIFCEQLLKWFMALLLAAFVLISFDLYYSWPMVVSGELAWYQALGGHVVAPYARISFGFFTIAWCKAFSLLFERRLNFYACTWGELTGHVDDVKPVVNPSFREMTPRRPSTLNANVMVNDTTFDEKFRGKLYCFASSLLLLCVGFLVDAFFMQIETYYRKVGFMNSASVIGVCLTIQIKIFNTLWGRVVPHFVKFEYHATLQAHCDECAKKVFYVQFLNTFGAFYYAAFLMRPLGDPALNDFGNAWDYLACALAIRYTSFVFLSLFTMTVPLLKMVRAMYKEEKKLRDTSLLPSDFERTSFIEFQAKLPVYSASDLNADYMKVILPLGFVLCFGITYPLGTGLALVAFIITIRLNTWKLITLYRRPYPFRYHGHWIWKQVIREMLWIAEVTNMGLIAFVMKPFSSWHFEDQLLMFFALLIISQLLSQFLNTIIYPMSPGVLLCLERQDYQQSKLTKDLYYRERLNIPPEKEFSVKPGEYEINHFLKIPGVYKHNGKLVKGTDAISGGDSEKAETSWSKIKNVFVLFRGVFKRDTYKLQAESLKSHRREELLKAHLPDVECDFSHSQIKRMSQVNKIKKTIKHEGSALLNEDTNLALQCQTTHTPWWDEKATEQVTEGAVNAVFDFLKH